MPFQPIRCTNRQRLIGGNDARVETNLAQARREVAPRIFEGTIEVVQNNILLGDIGTVRTWEQVSYRVTASGGSCTHP